jgi:hypothetical protein
MGRVAATRSPRTRTSPSIGPASTDSFGRASVDKARVRATGKTVSPHGARYDAQKYRKIGKAMSPRSEAAAAEQAATALVQNLKSMGYDLTAGVYSMGSESVDENDRYGASPVSSAKDEDEERDADDTVRIAGMKHRYDACSEYTDGRDLATNYGAVYGSEDHTEFERTVIYSASGRNSEPGPEKTNERTTRDTAVTSQDTNDWTQATDYTRETGIQTRATNYSRDTDYQTRASYSQDSKYHTRATDFTPYTREPDKQTRAAEYTRESSREKRRNSVGSRRKPDYDFQKTASQTKHSKSPLSSLHKADSGSDSLSDVTDAEFAKLMDQSFDASLDTDTFSRVVGSEKRRKGRPDKNRGTRAESSGKGRTSISPSRSAHEPREMRMAAKSRRSLSVDASSRNTKGSANASGNGKPPMGLPSPVGAATNSTTYTAKNVESPRHGRTPSPIDTSRYTGISGRFALSNQGESLSHERRVSPSKGTTTYENSSRNLPNSSPRKSRSIPMSIPKISPQHLECYTPRKYPPANEEFMTEVSDERFPLSEAQDISAEAGMKDKPSKKGPMSRFISLKKQRVEEIEGKPVNDFGLVSRAEFFREIEPKRAQIIVEPETEPKKKGIFGRIITKRLRPKAKDLPQLARSSSMKEDGAEWSFVSRESECLSEADGGEFDHYAEDQEGASPFRRNRLKVTIGRLPSPKKSRRRSEGGRFAVEDVARHSVLANTSSSARTLHFNKDYCHIDPISAMTMSKSEDSGDRNSAANRSTRASRKDPSVTDRAQPDDDWEVPTGKESRAKVSAGIALKKGSTSRAVKTSDYEPEVLSQKSPGIVASAARTDAALCEADDRETVSEKAKDATSVEIVNDSEPIKEKSADAITAERLNEKQEAPSLASSSKQSKQSVQCSTVATTTSRETGKVSAKSQDSQTATTTSSVRLNPLETSALDYDIDEALDLALSQQGSPRVTKSNQATIAQQGNDTLTSLEIPSKRSNSLLLKLKLKVNTPKKSISGLLRKGFTPRSKNESENEIYPSTREKGQGETNDENPGDVQSSMGMASAAGESPDHVQISQTQNQSQADGPMDANPKKGLGFLSHNFSPTPGCQRQSDEGPGDKIPMKHSTDIPLVSMEKKNRATSDSSTDCTVETSKASVAPPLQTSSLDKRAESPRAPERKKGLKKLLQRRLPFSTKQALPPKLPKELPLRNDEGPKITGQKQRHYARAEENSNDECNSEAAVATIEGIRREDGVSDHSNAKTDMTSDLEPAEDIGEGANLFADPAPNSVSVPYASDNRKSPSPTTLEMKSLESEQSTRWIDTLGTESDKRIVMSPKTRNGVRSSLARATCGTVEVDELAQTTGEGDKAELAAATLSRARFQNFSSLQASVDTDNSIAAVDLLVRENKSVLLAPTEFRGPLDVPENRMEEGKIPNYTVCGLFGEFFSEGIPPANESDVEKKGVRFSEDLEFVREIPALSLSASETSDSYNNRSVEEELSHEAATTHAGRKRLFSWLRRDTRGRQNALPNIREDGDVRTVDSYTSSEQGSLGSVSEYSSVDEDMSLGDSTASRSTKGNEYDNIMAAVNLSDQGGIKSNIRVNPRDAGTRDAKPANRSDQGGAVSIIKVNPRGVGTRDAKRVESKNGTQNINPVEASSKAALNEDEGIELIARRTKNGKNAILIAKTGGNPRYEISADDKAQNPPKKLAVKNGASFPPQKFATPQVPAQPPRKESPSFRLFHSKGEKTEANKKKAHANNQKTRAPKNPTSNNRNTVNTTDGILKVRSSPSSPVTSGSMRGISSPSELLTAHNEKGRSSPSDPAPDNTVKGRSIPSALAPDSAVPGRTSPGLPQDDNVKGRSSLPGLTPDSNATEWSSPPTLGPNTTNTSGRPTTLSENMPSRKDDQNGNEGGPSSIRGGYVELATNVKNTQQTAQYATILDTVQCPVGLRRYDTDDTSKKSDPALKNAQHATILDTVQCPVGPRRYDTDDSSKNFDPASKNVASSHTDKYTRKMLAARDESKPAAAGIDAARKHISATASVDFSENTTDRKRRYPAERMSNTKAVDGSWFSWLLPKVLPAWQETEPKTKHAKEEREQLFGNLSMDSTKDDDTTSQISGPSINSRSVENEAWQEILDAKDTMATKFEQHQSEIGDDDNRSISDETLQEVNDAISKFREHAARLGVNERELMAAIRDDGSVQSLMRNDSATTATIESTKPKKGLMSEMGNVTDQFIEMFEVYFTQNDAYTK